MNLLVRRRFQGPVVNMVSGTRVLLAAACATALWLVACTSPSPVPLAGLEQSIESASTRADHEELAKRYEQQAVLDRDTAKRHERYAAAYRKNGAPRSGPGQHLKLARHCDNLAQAYRNAADENASMAALHREIAASIP